MFLFKAKEKKQCFNGTRIEFKLKNIENVVLHFKKILHLETHTFFIFFIYFRIFLLTSVFYLFSGKEIPF